MATATNVFAAGSAPLEIESVEVSLLQASTDEPIGMAFTELNRRAIVLVSVTAADGTTGYGESWVNHPSWAGFERLVTFHHGVLPLLVGQDASQISAIHERLLSRLVPLGIQWGALGPIMQALSGVNLALWDLLGKVQEMSVSELLGGRFRDQVSLYASSIGPLDVPTSAAKYRDQGFSAVKLRMGFGAETDLRNLRDARKALGDSAALFVDANQSWRLSEALAIAPTLREHGVGWVEEPLRGNDLGELRKLADAAGLRIATGENLYGHEGFSPYIAEPGIAVLQPDLAKTGGFTECQPISQMAQDADKEVIPHLYGGALAYAATLQYAACSPMVSMIEFDVRSNPLRDPLLATPITVEGGVATVPTGPGLGVELDLDAVEACRHPADSLIKRAIAMDFRDHEVRTSHTT